MTGCNSTKKLISQSEVKPAKFSQKKINGTYKTKFKDSDTNNLWEILYRNESFKKEAPHVINTMVRLSLLNDNQIKVELLENNQTIKEIVLNGKIRNNYFEVDKNKFLIPIPFLYFHDFTKTLIGNDDFGNLVVVQNYKRSAWVLIFAASHGGISNYKSEKIKN